eukprot:1722406-Amphidinium_carterae.1
MPYSASMVHDHMTPDYVKGHHINAENITAEATCRVTLAVTKLHYSSASILEEHAKDDTGREQCTNMPIQAWLALLRKVGNATKCYK